MALVTSDAQAGLIEGHRCHPASRLVATMPHPSHREADEPAVVLAVEALLHSVYDQPDADALHALFNRIRQALLEKPPPSPTTWTGPKQLTRPSPVCPAGQSRLNRTGQP